jgi:hypothetical protein
MSVLPCPRNVWVGFFSRDSTSFCSLEDQLVGMSPIIYSVASLLAYVALSLEIGTVAADSTISNPKTPPVSIKGNGKISL